MKKATPAPRLAKLDGPQKKTPAKKPFAAAKKQSEANVVKK